MQAYQQARRCTSLPASAAIYKLTCQRGDAETVTAWCVTETDDGLRGLVDTASILRLHLWVSNTQAAAVYAYKQQNR